MDADIAALVAALHDAGQALFSPIIILGFWAFWRIDRRLVRIEEKLASIEDIPARERRQRAKANRPKLHQGGGRGKS